MVDAPVKVLVQAEQAPGFAKLPTDFKKLDASIKKATSGLRWWGRDWMRI